MSRHSRSITAMRVVLAICSMLIIVALVVGSCIFRPSWLKADSAEVSNASVSHTVSPRQVSTYCPARMTIADTDSYGDSEYQASNGNIASSARYSAFGSVFRSSVFDFGAQDDSSALAVEKRDSDSQQSLYIASGSVDGGSQLQNTRLLSATDGTGSVSSVMSWATDGDLKGVSAVSCIQPALEQTFLVAGTKTGTTQQLVVANSSSKAASVTVRVWGADKSGTLALSTGSTLAVGAGTESIMNLAAAAPDQEALYVSVSSTDAPIAAVVRTIDMDGLTPKGSDYSAPNNVSAKTLAMSGISEGDSASVYVYAGKTTDVTVSWIGEKGATQANQQTLEGGRVSVIDLSKAPGGAEALSISADEQISAAVRITDDGDGDQADFALVNAVEPMTVSAMAIPDQATALVDVANMADDEKTATLTAYNADGEPVDQRDITLKSKTSTKVDLSDINEGDVAAVSLSDPDGAMVWNARITQQDVSEAKLAGIAVLGAVSLKEARETVFSNNDMTVVR